MIVCRNVMIYFDKDLQDKVINLFYESLVPGGFLCLGSKESLRFASAAPKFDATNERQKIYRKKFEV
jgi:chemotaxis protein methyltransferase CheR